MCVLFTVFAEMSRFLQATPDQNVPKITNHTFVISAQQHMEERPAGGGHDRESGGAGASAGQREAGVFG